MTDQIPNDAKPNGHHPAIRQSYDLIGDIHGHAEELTALLESLGYRRANGSGPYSHPEGRRAIFLGDYIDRGPCIRDVLRVVRGMTECGSAHALLGNHEVNALRFHTIGRSGKPLRSHSPGNIRQHQATLDQFPDPEELRDWLGWFAGLPICLDLGGLRAVHAAWHPEAIAAISGLGPLTGDILEEYSVRGTESQALLSLLLNGPEGLLPKGHDHLTGDGVRRREFRLKWWLDLTGANCREAIFPDSAAVPELPPRDLPATGYPEDAPPTFFGHYALRDPAPRLLRSNLACLDYGMGKGGFLCAYRWDGESVLDATKLVGGQGDS